MSRPEQGDLRLGSCLDLPPAVVDKYFMANSKTERFQVETAKAICGRCAVQAACLMDAIKVPWPSGGIRGGELETSIRDLHRRFESGENIDLLTIEALRKQKPLRGKHGAESLRSGAFKAVDLLPLRRPSPPPRS